MKKLVIVILFWSSVCFGQSSGHQLDYTFSLDSSYPSSSITNRAFWNFGLEFEYFGATLFDYVGNTSLVNSNGVTRLLWALGMSVAWDIPQYSFFVSNHELGHGSRNLAVNATPSYQWSVTGATAHDSIFSFFIEGFGRFGEGAVTNGGTTSGPVPTNWTDMVLLAAGVNNSQMFSEHLEKEVYNNTGHINQLTAYARGKLDAYNYVRATVEGSGEGDMDQLVTLYQGKGYDISLSDIKDASDLSRLLSFTYWAYAYGIYNYIVTGDPTVRSFEVGGFKLPDLGQYLNRDGMSYKISSAYRAENYTIPFSIEQIQKGEDETEISVGYRKQKPLTTNRSGAYEAVLYYNSEGALGYEFSVDYLVGQQYIFSAGYNNYDTDTLIGERNLGKISGDGSSGSEFWARVSMTY